jgi:hypothetical protein
MLLVCHFSKAKGTENSTRCHVSVKTKVFVKTNQVTRSSDTQRVSLGHACDTGVLNLIEHFKDIASRPHWPKQKQKKQTLLAKAFIMP